MPAMATALTEFQDSGNSRNYITAGHTVTLPKMVLSRRKPPASIAGAVGEVQASVLSGTVDSDSEPLAARVMLTATARVPVGGADADVDAAIVIFRDMVASDEFVTFVKTQAWLS